MKWIFVTATFIIELSCLYLFQVNGWMVYPILLSLIGALVIKVTNEKNSIIQNQIAFGLFFGTIFTLIVLVLFVLWLLNQMH